MSVCEDLLPNPRTMVGLNGLPEVIRPKKVGTNALRPHISRSIHDDMSYMFQDGYSVPFRELLKAEASFRFGFGDVYPSYLDFIEAHRWTRS